MDLFKHYRKLAHFSLLLLRGDLTGDNVRLMREYYAQVVLGEVRDLLSIDNKRVLDVGGADGTFCKVFHNELGGEAINLDFHATCANLRWRDSVRGSAHKLPFNDNMFDLVLCRGVLEHIPLERQQIAINEMRRVTGKGGICYIAFPPWYNPFAGHALRPFHILPFKLAKRLTLFFFSKAPLDLSAQSYADCFLFPITVRRMLRMLRKSGLHVVAVKDHHFRLHQLAKIPFVRELMVPTVAFIAQA